MLLTLLIFLPLLGAIALALLPSSDAKLLRTVTLGVTTAVAVLSVSLFTQFDGAIAAAQFVEHKSWFKLGDIEINYRLGVDGMSILLVALTGLLFVPWMFHWAGRRAIAEREALEQLF